MLATNFNLSKFCFSNSLVIVYHGSYILDYINFTFKVFYMLYSHYEYHQKQFYNHIVGYFAVCSLIRYNQCNNIYKRKYTYY